jgi:hypothetical protein
MDRRVWQAYGYLVRGENAHAGPPPAGDANLEMLKLADQHFLFDLEQFWQRARFFVVIHGALFSVFVSIADDGRNSDLDVLIVAFGVLLALYWAWISLLTADRIGEWRRVVMTVEQTLPGAHIFEAAEQHAVKWRKNPTVVACLLPPAVGAMWVIAAILA